MNEIKFRCPHCEAVAAVDETRYGQVVHCPQCGGEVQMPDRPKPKPPVAELVEDDPTPTAKPEETPQTSAVPPRADISSQHTEEVERDIATFRPSMKGLIGSMATGILLLVVALAILVGSAGQEGERWTDFGYGGLLLALFGALSVLKVWIRVKTTVYRLTTERFLIKEGWLAKKHEEVELYRISDVSLTQNFWDRLVKTGNITVTSTDQSTPFLNLPAIPDALNRKEEIRIAYRKARKKEGVLAGERFID